MPSRSDVTVSLAEDGVTQLASQATTATAHYGMVVLVAPSVLKTVLERCDNIQEWASGLVDCCIVENGVDSHSVGCRRRTLLGAGIPGNHLQSTTVLPDSTNGNAAGNGAALQRQEKEGAATTNSGVNPYNPHAMQSLLGSVGAFKGCLIREEMTKKIISDTKSSMTLSLVCEQPGYYLQCPSPISSSGGSGSKHTATDASRFPLSPFGGIDVREMTTTVSVSSISTDPFKSFLEFHTEYTFVSSTTLTENEIAQLHANGEDGAFGIAGGYLPATTNVQILSAQQYEAMDAFLSNYWLKHQALCLNEYALNAAYPVLGVDPTSAEVATNNVRDATDSNVMAVVSGSGGNKSRVSIAHRAEYQQYEEQLVAFHSGASSTSPTVAAAGLDANTVIAAYERLLSSWTLLVEDEARKDQALAAARSELMAARHVTNTAAGTLVATAQRVATAYDQQESVVDVKPSSPTGGHEAAGGATEPLPTVRNDDVDDSEMAMPTPQPTAVEIGGGAETTTTGGHEMTTSDAPAARTIPTPPAAPPAAAPAPAETFDMATIRKAVASGAVLTEMQMTNVFNSLDTNKNGFLTTTELQQLWQSFEDYGQYDEGVGLNAYLSSAREKRQSEMSTPIKQSHQPVGLRPSSTPTSEPGTNATMVGDANAVGVTNTRKQRYFVKLVDDWVRKNLAYRVGRSTPRRQRGGEESQSTTTAFPTLQITYQEFCLFMLQMARR